MGGLVEAAEKLVEPIGKLIDCVSGAIGKAYEPRHIRNVANAEAYKIKKIGEALRENSDIPIEYNPDGISLSTADYEQFVKRTQSRLAYQELKKQENIEAVLDNAYEEVLALDSVSTEPVDCDWLNSFFDFVGNISNEEMQKLWGKLLAGEIERPGSFSIRTLDTLRKLTSKEASVFQKLVPYILTCAGDKEQSYTDYFLPIEFWYKDITKKYNFSSYEIILLQEIGLLNNEIEISVVLSIEPHQSECINSANGRIIFTNITEQPIELHHQATVLTAVGKELYAAVSRDCLELPPDGYIEDCQIIFSKNNEFDPATTKHPVEISIVIN